MFCVPTRPARPATGSAAVQGGRWSAGVHGLEEAADEVVGAGGRGAVVEELGDEILGQQVNVLREESDEHLEDEPLGVGLRHAAFDELAEAVGEAVGGLARDDLAVVVEGGPGRAGREEGQRPPPLRQVGQHEGVLGRVEVGVEIVDAELVEVAEDDVARAVGHEAHPVVERLPVVLLERLAALFHLDEHDGFPDEVGERGAAAVLAGLADAELRRAADIERAGLAEGLEEAVEEDLGLAFFVAGDVLAAPVDELGEFRGVSHAMSFTRETGAVSSEAEGQHHAVLPCSQSCKPAPPI